MDRFSDITWLAFAAVAAFGLVQVLRALAISVRNATMIHDLRVRVAELQVQQYHAQMLRHGVVPKDQIDNSEQPEAASAASNQGTTNPTKPEQQPERPADQEAEQPTGQQADQQAQVPDDRIAA